MKNIKLYPFARNKYFFGKLLTVRDFEVEQQYFNDKRRVLNHLLFGAGVVCGLTVTRVDGSTVAIESGLALDSTGREILVPKAVVTRLSEFDGFMPETGEISPHIYLCAEYNEEEREPVQGVETETQHNKTEEGYRFFLTYDEPPVHKPHNQLSANLEKRFKDSERLYLAKIHLVQWGTAYEIEDVIPLPFGQIVPSPLYCYQAISALNDEIDTLKAMIRGKNCGE